MQQPLGRGDSRRACLEVLRSSTGDLINIIHFTTLTQTVKTNSKLLNVWHSCVCKPFLWHYKLTQIQYS